MHHNFVFQFIKSHHSFYTFELRLRDSMPRQHFHASKMVHFEPIKISAHQFLDSRVLLGKKTSFSPHVCRFVASCGSWQGLCEEPDYRGSGRCFNITARTHTQKNYRMKSLTGDFITDAALWQITEASESQGVDSYAPSQTPRISLSGMKH